MDSTTTISMEILLSLSSGIIGSVGAYIKLKSRIDRLEVENLNQERELLDLRERKKEMNTALHKRIDDQKAEVQELRNELNKGHQALERKMGEMELRIIKEIHKLVKS